MKNVKILVPLLAAAFAFANRASAQSYDINWFTIDGGGGESIAGIYALQGTIGQPGVETMSGGTFSLQGGFWAPGFNVETGEPPKLTVLRSQSHLLLSWPVRPHFILERNPDLSLPGNWSEVTQTEVLKDGTVSVTVPIPLSTEFFRLRK